MITTYRNDNCLSNYPFMADNVLPFGRSCIADIGLSILESKVTTTPIVVTSVVIGPTYAYIHVGRGSESLGVFSLNLQASNTATFEAYSDICSGGFVVLHKDIRDAEGSYKGPFVIHPKCISRIPDSTVGKHKEVFMHGIRSAIGQVLSIQTASLLALEGNTIIGTSTEDITTVYSGTGKFSYAGVSDINRVDITTNTYLGNTLHITTKELADVTDLLLNISGASIVASDKDKVDNLSDEARSANAGKVVTLTVTGGSGIPSCYDKDKDEANP